MSEDIDDFDDAAPQNIERINELYTQIAEMLGGESVFDAIGALEKIAVNIMVANCVHKAAACQVLDTMYYNMEEMIDHMDECGMAVWHHASKNN